MVRIEYVEHGNAISDFDLDDELERIKVAMPDGELFYSTTNIFYVVSLKVALGELDHEKIVFVYKGQHLAIDQFGYTERPEHSEGFLLNYAKIARERMLAEIATRQRSKHNDTNETGLGKVHTARHRR